MRLAERSWRPVLVVLVRARHALREACSLRHCDGRVRGCELLIAASVQSTTGIGFAWIASPVLFALLNPQGAILAVTAFDLVRNLLVSFAERRRPVVPWREVLPVLAAVVPGAISGVVILLRAVPKPVLQVGVGAAAVGAVLVLATSSPARSKRRCGDEACRRVHHRHAVHCGWDRGASARDLAELASNAAGRSS
jgi:Sulfite exporter TauE/SafE